MKVLILVLFSTSLAFFPKPQEPHVGQPATCNNYYDNTHKCECERAQSDCKDPNQSGTEEPGTKCQTYCRKDACKCANPCNS